MALCGAPLTPWVSGAASYVLVRIANAGECDRVVFVLLGSTFDKGSTDVVGLDSKRVSNEISLRITPSLTFVHEMKSRFAFGSRI